MDGWYGPGRSPAVPRHPKVLSSRIPVVRCPEATRPAFSVPTGTDNGLITAEYAFGSMVLVTADAYAGRSLVLGVLLVTRRLGPVLTALLISGVLASVGVAAPVAAASPVPKVVIIVGPAGGATDGYRAQARAAAAAARKYTPDVTEVYSPNATWPAVKAALQGASLVVYMGHGNGWPSPYRDSLYRPTQNGFGLNPRAGGNDDTHQYFGESRVAASIDLAKNAVVLLHHLCYASGNAEPQAARGHARPGQAARRQLRRRVHRRRRIGRHRRGPRRPGRLRQVDPRREPVHRRDLAFGARRERPCLRVREPAEPRIRRPDGPERTCRPASNARSCCGRASPPPMCSPAPAGPRAVAPGRSCPDRRTCSRPASASARRPSRA